MKQTEHTKGEWTVGETDIRNSSITIWCERPETNTVAGYTTLIGYISMADVDTDEEAQANAEVICTAVNNHQQLVDIAKELQGHLQNKINTLSDKGTDALKSYLHEINNRALTVIAEAEQ